MNKAFFLNCEYECLAHVARIPLVSVFWGSGVLGAFKEANDAITSHQSNFSKKQDYKFLCHGESVTVSMYLHFEV